MAGLLSANNHHRDTESLQRFHCFNICHFTVFKSGLYVRLNTTFVTVLVALVPELELPLLLPPPLVLDDVLDDVRCSVPKTLNVTVNGSLPGLLNFSRRGPDVSFGESMLSVPTFVS